MTKKAMERATRGPRTFNTRHKKTNICPSFRLALLVTFMRGNIDSLEAPNPLTKFIVRLRVGSMLSRGLLMSSTMIAKRDRRMPNSSHDYPL